MDLNEPQQPNVEEGSFFNPNLSDTPIRLKHSGPGIASFVLCMVSLLGYIATVALIGALISPYLNLTSPDEEAIQKLGLAFLLVILFILMNVIGIVLGIVGISLKKRKKIFAILGLIINGVIVLSIAAFFVIAVVSSTT